MLLVMLMMIMTMMKTTHKMTMPVILEMMLFNFVKMTC